MNTGSLLHTNTARPGNLATATGVAAIAVLAAVLMRVFYVGFQASDDANYIQGALGWLNDFPYVGVDHWTLRHTITIPTALAIGLFGLREWAVSLSGIVYYLGFLVLNGYCLAKTLGRPCAVIALLIWLLAPGFTVAATYLNPDIPEVFFVSAAFWTLLAAQRRPQSTRLWLLLGVLTGLGFINRQTAAAFVLFVVLVFAFRAGAPRSRYLIAGGAFVAVFGAQWLYLTLLTGNPLYRESLDFHHGAVHRFADVSSIAAQGRWIDNEGNLSLNAYMDPLLALFVSQKYGLEFWLAIPAGVAAWRLRHSAAGKVPMLLLAFALVAFLFVAFNPKLVLVPRYLLIAAWAATVLGAWWLASYWRSGRRTWAVAGLLLALLAGAAGLAVENTDPRKPERMLVEWVQQHPGQTIYTDIETRARSSFYFRFAGVSMDDVKAEAPPPGGTFYACAGCVKQCLSSPRCAGNVEAFRPRPGWQVQNTLRSPTRPAAPIVSALGLERVLPTEVAQRLTGSGRDVTLYRVPAQP